jgi:hypothetical protein
MAHVAQSCPGTDTMAAIQLLDLPPELFLKIILATDLDTDIISNLLRVSRHMNSFMKSHEPVIVMAAVEKHDELAGMLAFTPKNASYHRLREFRSHEAIFQSLMARLQDENETYGSCYGGHYLDRNSRSLVEYAPLIRAGFLLHFQCRCINELPAKEEFIRGMPLETWALLCAFTEFLRVVVQKTYAATQPYYSLSNSVTTFIVEICFYAGLKPLFDFLFELNRPLQPDDGLGVEKWAKCIGEKYVNAGFDIKGLKLVVHSRRAPDVPPESFLACCSRFAALVVERNGPSIKQEPFADWSHFEYDTILVRTKLKQASLAGERDVLAVLRKLEAIGGAPDSLKTLRIRSVPYPPGLHSDFMIRCLQRPVIPLDS